ncbi:hypothetical protein [Burkholderia gladioli]|uniref:hypothetical protein n=1 Tax=Burkholderia gladioli TaxID=28095 RepID=UPI001640125E|nr:hypothetical protein [Burkholderia gladioli]
MKVSSRHIGVAAEAAAAALFARVGYDVSVQYGADQPEYDLIVAAGERMLKVSVKGSQDGRWGLSQGCLVKGTRDYHTAAEAWRLKHTPRTILCLVQYKGIAVEQMPRVYLATPNEIAGRLCATARGRGDTILYEKHVWAARAYGAGSIEEIPTIWAFSAERVEKLLSIA